MVISVNAEKMPVVDEPFDRRLVPVHLAHALEQCLRSVDLALAHQKHAVLGQGWQVVRNSLQHSPVKPFGLRSPSAKEVLNGSEEVEPLHVVRVDLDDPVQQLDGLVYTTPGVKPQLRREAQQQLCVIDESWDVVWGLLQRPLEVFLCVHCIALYVQQDPPVLVQRVHVRRAQLQCLEEVGLGLLVVAVLLQQRPIPRKDINFLWVLLERTHEKLLCSPPLLPDDKQQVSQVAECGHMLRVEFQCPAIHLLCPVWIVPVILQQTTVVVQGANVARVKLQR
mmetsp:Transcript_35758/g.73507  ORF Transcript_35758/g.73507 Transcript_35758/m.73507 type:complete len:280 (-) Transcript_35758:752-1591(-)